MTKIHLAGAAALATLFISVPASAQDFTGFRAEVRTGYDALAIDDNYEDIADSLSGTGFVIAAGYDWPLGPDYTIGIESSILLPAGTAESVKLGSDILEMESKRDIDALVRLGRVVNDKTLLFVKAGYASSQVDWTYTSLIAPGETMRVDYRFDGLRVGVGGERILGRGVSATAEYRYTNYEDDVSRNQALVGLTYRF